MHAAAFLRRFVGDTPWVHLDIAGTEIREEATATAIRSAPPGLACACWTA